MGEVRIRPSCPTLTVSTDLIRVCPSYHDDFMQAGVVVVLSDDVGP